MMKKVFARAGVGLGVVSAITVAALGAMTSGAAAAAPTASGDEVSTVVRKSVSISADPSGTPSSSIMVTQLSSVGNGNTTVKVPIGTQSLRNLDGFTTQPTEGDKAIFNLNVSGAQEQRIYTKSDPGPVSVKTGVTLDGKPIAAADVVNKTGVLNVTYTVTNNSGTTQDVTYQDAAGNTLSEKVLVPDPIGGSATIVLPQGFNEITAPSANIGGDGHGGNQLDYSLVLFPPLGAPVGTVSYQSRITNGTLPSVEMTFLPIVPFDNSSVNTAKSAFEGGSSTSVEIYNAGQEIGDNLIKLQTGASKLMAGLEEAQAGAAKIGAGLNNEAIPGAKALATGLSGTAVPGAKAIAAGGKLMAATAKAGLPDAKAAATGSAALAAGTVELSKGLVQLQAGINGLPAAVQAQLNANPLFIQAVTTLAALTNGGTVQASGMGVSVPGWEAASASLWADATTLGNLAGGADPVTCPAACQAALAPVATNVNPAAGLFGTGSYGSWFLIAGGTIAVPPLIARTPGLVPQLNAALVPLVNELVDTIKSTLLGTACGTAGQAVNCMVDTVNNPTVGVGLVASTTALADGLASLPDSINASVAAGLQFQDGGNELADGLQTAADGALKLADGLQPAADGALKIADGLGAAVTGAGEIAAGAGKLNTEGAQKLSETAVSGGKTYSADVAVLNAMQKQGLEGKGIPYGKAEGHNTTTTGVYQMVIASPETPGTNNAMRYALALIGLLIAVAAGTALWHRNNTLKARI